MSEDKAVAGGDNAATAGGPEADKAAAKIQAGFRGYRVRKRLQEERKAKEKVAGYDDDDEDDSSIQHRPDSPDLIGNQHSDDEEKPQSALEEKSATKIQAGIRGFLVRKRQQAEQLAATRIQAGFRGFRTRKLLKQSGQ